MSRGAYLLSLGLVPYGDAFELQRSLAGAVSQGAIPETVIFLEHPPVVTLGRRTETYLELHLPDDAEVEIAETDRGGRSTYHAPGQLVLYPIVHLGEGHRDVRAWVRHLEAFLIRLLGESGIPATTHPEHPGVWTVRSGKKIASVGIAIQHWVSFHGVADRKSVV